jgi:hypothetical protein
MSNQTQLQPTGQNWDLFRLSKSKIVVDLVPNTLREYHDQGLPFYRRGKAVFISRTELNAFIRLGPEKFKASFAA